MPNSAPKTQLVFDIKTEPSYAPESYMITESTMHIFGYAENLSKWHNPTCIITGAKGSGKTHILNALMAKYDQKHINFDIIENWYKGRFDQPIRNLIKFGDIIIIDDFDKGLKRIDADKWLFDLLNLSKEVGAYVLLTSLRSDMDDIVDLKDLSSRLSLAQKFMLPNLDESILLAVMMKKASENNLDIHPRVFEYMLNTMPRDYYKMLHAIDGLTDLSLSRKSSVTIPMVKAFLKDDSNLSYRFDS